MGTFITPLYNEESEAQRGAVAGTTWHPKSEGQDSGQASQTLESLCLTSDTLRTLIWCSVLAGTEWHGPWLIPTEESPLAGRPQPHPRLRALASPSSQWSSSPLKTMDLSDASSADPRGMACLLLSGERHSWEGWAQNFKKKSMGKRTPPPRWPQTSAWLDLASAFPWPTSASPQGCC